MIIDDFPSKKTIRVYEDGKVTSTSRKIERIVAVVGGGMQSTTGEGHTDLTNIEFDLKEFPLVLYTTHVKRMTTYVE